MMLHKRTGMTIAELLISILIFSIFLIVLFASLNIIINAMETQDMIVSKLYTASKINFLFGILEDEFKWLGSFGKGVAALGDPFDVHDAKGFEVKPTPGSSDVVFDYQYAVIENFVLQKQEDNIYEAVFSDTEVPTKANTQAGQKHLVILAGNLVSQDTSVATALLDQVSPPGPYATDATVTFSPYPLSHPATKVYFVRIRDGNSTVKPEDENGNSDYLEQLVRGTLRYDYESSEITLSIRKGFSSFHSTMTVLDGVDTFELLFYEGGWKTADELANFSNVKAIQARITLNIPVSESIKKRCEENPEMIQLTKTRVFWLPPDEDL